MSLLVATVRGQWLNPIKVSKSIPKEHIRIRKNRKAVVKPADHPVNPTQPGSITLRLTPAVCHERMEQLEAWTMCVCLCVCLEESATASSCTNVCVYMCTVL